MTAPGPEHAGDLLSAHLDGELAPDRARWVGDHVASCAECRAEQDDLVRARGALRSLPALDATGLVDGVVARRHRLLRFGALFVAVAGLAAGMLAMRADVRHPVVVPDTVSLVRAHELTAGGDMARASDAVPGMPGLRPVVAAGSAYAAPSGLIGNRVSLSRQAVFDGTDLTVVLYEDGGIRASVFQQPGTLDWDALGDGDIVEVDVRRVWIGSGSPVVGVTEVGDLVVSVVSDDVGAVLTVVGGLPERHRRSTWERVHDACQRFTEVFALGS